MRRPAPTLSIRMLMLAVAIVAASMSWSAHWSDCKYQAVLHATLAAAGRQEDRVGQASPNRRAEWREEMSRRFERAAWLPWPFPPSEPPRPEPL
jgi:hypothetical protein